MTIRFVNLQAQYASLRPEIDAAIQRVLDQTAFVFGEETDLFEQEFADYVGTQFAVGVSSGTAALELALRACGIGPGDEVITVPNTFIATTEAITHTGASIKFVDVDPVTYNIDPKNIERAITSSTKAIIPVHLFGQMADMPAIMQIARKHGLKVIEDAAQAHGATSAGAAAGTLGDAACFSFYPSKNLGAYGDAGAVTTDDEDVADELRLLRSHGERVKYHHEIEGFCYRIDNLQSAILRVKLPHLNDWNERRRAAARRYTELLADVGGVVTPMIAEASVPAFHLYVVLVSDRDRVREDLGAADIQSGIHYPVPLHMQEAYARLGHAPGDFPVAADLAGRQLSLPLCPEIEDDQLQTVVDVLKRVVRA